MPTVKPGRIVVLAALLVASAAASACGGGGVGSDDSTGAQQATSSSTAGSESTTVDDESLINCSTDIASDVPEFYRRYFRCVSISRTDAGVTITTQGLPPHRSYYYGAESPYYTEFDTSRGTGYRPNPNEIAAQNLSITIADSPEPSGVTITGDIVDGEANTNDAEYGLGAIGVAIDGVALFGGTAGPGDDLENERLTFDSYEGHPEMRGAYHYHGPSPGPLEVLRALGFVTTTTPGSAEIELYGILRDGTIVLGCTELDGTTPAGELDAQGGHVGDIVGADGTVFFTERYHTHLCMDAERGHRFTAEIRYYE